MKTTKENRETYRKTAHEAAKHGETLVFSCQIIAALLDDLDEAEAALNRRHNGDPSIPMTPYDYGYEQGRADSANDVRETSKRNDVLQLSLGDQSRERAKYERGNRALRTALAESRAREERLTRESRKRGLALGALHKFVLDDLDRGYVLTHEPNAAALWRARRQEVLVTIDAALAPAPASREGAEVCSACGGAPHAPGCIYADAARSRDPSGEEAANELTREAQRLGMYDAPAQAADDAERAAREWLETPDEDGRYVCDDSDDDFCAKLAALLRARDEATWNAAVEACAKELEDPKLFNVHPTMLRSIRDLKKHGGPASG